MFFVNRFLLFFLCVSMLFERFGDSIILPLGFKSFVVNTEKPSLLHLLVHLRNRTPCETEAFLFPVVMSKVKEFWVRNIAFREGTFSLCHLEGSNDFNLP